MEKLFVSASTGAMGSLLGKLGTVLLWVCEKKTISKNEK
jgi:hypothetical protein